MHAAAPTTLHPSERSRSTDAQWFSLKRPSCGGYEPTGRGTRVRGTAGASPLSRLGALHPSSRCVIPLWLMCIGKCPGKAVVSSCSWQCALTCGGVCGCSGESSLLRAVEKATAEAEKHGDRSEKLSSLVAETRKMLEQAKTENAERARVAAEEAEAAAAVKAVAGTAEAAAKAVVAPELLQMEEQMAALALRMEEAQATLTLTLLPHPRRRCAWCAWTRLRIAWCCRASACACVRRAPSCSATAARCVAGPSDASCSCSPRKRQA
jgi:hypothetical protein